MPAPVLVDLDLSIGLAFGRSWSTSASGSKSEPESAALYGVGSIEIALVMGVLKLNDRARPRESFSSVTLSCSEYIKSAYL